MPRLWVRVIPTFLIRVIQVEDMGKTSKGEILEWMSGQGWLLVSEDRKKYRS